MTAGDREALAAGLVELGMEPAGPLLDALARYADEIELWNPRLKLVAASGRELVVRHLLDSVAGVAVLRERGLLDGVRMAADLGSGAGLPGIPAALVLPDVQVSLVERSGRRAGFLRNAVATLRLANARVMEADVARYAGPAHLVMHRAFRPLDAETLRVSMRPLVFGGVLCAYKGRRAAIEEELAALGRDSGFASVLPVTVPFLGEERHIVVIRKP